MRFLQTLAGQQGCGSCGLWQGDNGGYNGAFILEMENWHRNCKKKIKKMTLY